MSYTTRTTCRACSKNELIPLFSLGEHYINDFPTGERLLENEPLPKAPIELVMCPRCSLVQLLHTAPQDFLYSRFYWYRSGVTETMRTALADVARDIERRVDLGPRDVILDIGSNDGTLLRAYTRRDTIRVGVEPATNLVEEGSQGVNAFINDFWSSESYFWNMASRAKVVTALGMFYDLEDPNQFIGDIAKCLTDDGLFVAQLMCLQNMINICDIGNLCHEHLEFYSLKSLDRMFRTHGLEIIDIQTNAVNGQSYRLYMRPVGGSAEPLIGANDRLLAAWEAEKDLNRPETIKAFFDRMEENKRAVVDFIQSVVSQGKRVWVYGASTKGNTILQYYSLDHTLIEGASERSPEKWRRYTVGTEIPIFSEEEARKANPDYFLVLPYAFLDEFVRREEEWRSGGGRFIVPLPSFRIV